MGLRDVLLAVDDRQTKEVEALGRKIRIRELSGTDRDLITNLYMQAAGLNTLPPLIHETIIVRGVVDENGERVFKDEDREAIATQWGKSIKVLSDEILDLSGMAGDSIEGAEKNLPGDLNDASGSGSPLPSDEL